jgi:hypothetical protein
LSNKKDPAAPIEFKKTRKILKVACWLDSVGLNPAKKGFKYWCQDETKIGLKTIERKKITARGVKPIGLVQWNFKAYYLYGTVALKLKKISGWSFHILIVNVFKYSQIT